MTLRWTFSKGDDDKNDDSDGDDDDDGDNDDDYDHDNNNNNNNNDIDARPEMNWLMKMIIYAMYIISHVLHDI